MIAKKARMPVDVDEEVAGLIETLLEAGQRLEELTGGKVDTITGRDGTRFLLPHAQEELRQNDAAREAGILNALPAHIALIDRNGVISSVNGAWRRSVVSNVLQDPAHNIGVNYVRLCESARGADSAEARQAAAGMRSVLTGGADTFSIEYPCHAGGDLRWFILTVTPLANDLRNGAVVMHSDITEHKKAHDRYRGLLEAAPDAMVVVNVRGEIVLLNVQAEKQFGYRRDELVGQQVTNIIPEGFAERIIADRTRTAAEALAQQIGTGIELIALRKDGSEFPIEIMLSPLDSADGILFTAAIRDISRRKAEEQRYRGLLEAAPDAMVVVNVRGEIVLLNVQAEKQFGYRRDELLGQQVTNIIPEGFAERIIADGTRTAAEALAQQIGTGIELIALRKDGSEFPIEIMLSPLDSADGILFTAAIRDISERTRAEAELLHNVQELKRSNEELEQFAYLASHDLQEPLRMVTSYTQLLSRRYKDKLDSDANEFIGFAVDGASRMQRLIHDLLTFSRVGTKQNTLVETSSQAALTEALGNLRGAIEEKGAVVTHDSLPDVMADERQLVQLFQNLIGNAIKYQNRGVPEIHVSAVKSEGRWVFSVRDNGLGIESKYFEKIFGMFQRLHKREEYAGTGIGLAICRKIVERHGGTISVESEPGHGSTFRFGLAGSDAP